jgi:hypothetical protein
MTASIVSTDTIPLHLRLLYALEKAIADPEDCRTLDLELTALLDWFDGSIVTEEEMADLLSENAIQIVAMALQDRRIPSGGIILIKGGFDIVTTLTTSPCLAEGNLTTSPCLAEGQDRLACFFEAMGGIGGFVGLMEHHQNCPICSVIILQMLITLEHWGVIADELFGTHWVDLVALVEDALYTHLDTSPVIFITLMSILVKFPLLLRSLDRRAARYIYQSLVEYIECPLCAMLGQTVLEEIIGSSLLVKSFVECPCCQAVTCSAAA